MFAGWQVILCDPIWHASSCSGEASCLTAIHIHTGFNHIMASLANSLHLTTLPSPSSCVCHSACWQTLWEVSMLICEIKMQKKIKQ